jgi:xanthine dehydrogenase accessory factor
MKTLILDALLAARHAGVPAILATQLPGGAQSLILPDAILGDLALEPAVAAEAARLAAADISRIVDGQNQRIFVQAFNPPPRLIVVGAVHIAEPLSRMAHSAGYQVIIVDPRRAYANRTRFDGAKTIGGWPDEALADLALDRRTAVVTLTHDPKLDDAALLVAVRSPAFYIGCLGSRKTQDARLKRLRLAGLGDDELARIHGPVGLAIGALTPAEIAVSILAEITQVRRSAQEAPRPSA